MASPLPPVIPSSTYHPLASFLRIVLEHQPDAWVMTLCHRTGDMLPQTFRVDERFAEGLRSLVTATERERKLEASVDQLRTACAGHLGTIGDLNVRLQHLQGEPAYTAPSRPYAPSATAPAVEGTLRAVAPARYIVEERDANAPPSAEWRAYGVATTEHEALARAREFTVATKGARKVRVLPLYAFVPTEPQAFLGLVEAATASANRTNDELRAGLENVSKLVEEGQKREHEQQARLRSLDILLRQEIDKGIKQTHEQQLKAKNHQKATVDLHRWNERIRLRAFRAETMITRIKPFLLSSAQAILEVAIEDGAETPSEINYVALRRIRTLETENARLIGRNLALADKLGLLPSEDGLHPAPVTTVSTPAPPSSPGMSPPVIIRTDAQGNRYTDIAEGGTMKNPPGVFETEKKP